MQNEASRIANRIEGNLVEYICPNCGGYLTGEGIFRAFLPLVDHLITELCLAELRELSQPFIGNSLTGGLWFRDPDTGDVVFGLSGYDPDSPEWKRFLKPREKLLPQAKAFLPDIADWLEKALKTIEGLSSLGRSSLFVADRLVSFVRALPPEFADQKEYLRRFEEKLKETGMDTKWEGCSPGRAAFVGASLAGARWDLTPSTSRELVRQERLKLRAERFKKIGIVDPHRWWDPDLPFSPTLEERNGNY